MCVYKSTFQNFYWWRWTKVPKIFQNKALRAVSDVSVVNFLINGSEMKVLMTLKENDTQYTYNVHA